MPRSRNPHPNINYKTSPKESQEPTDRSHNSDLNLAERRTQHMFMACCDVPVFGHGHHGTLAVMVEDDVKLPQKYQDMALPPKTHESSEAPFYYNGHKLKSHLSLSDFGKGCIKSPLTRLLRTENILGLT